VVAAGIVSKRMTGEKSIRRSASFLQQDRSRTLIGEKIAGIAQPACFQRKQPQPMQPSSSLRSFCRRSIRRFSR
jgi:hypothetical protein